MTFQVRRVVTGHDKKGKAIVLSDETLTEPVTFRPGMDSYIAWSTNRLPADNSIDQPSKVTATTVEGGSVFRIIHYSPGVAPRDHRTESIDYAVVLSGAIDMELDDGVTVNLKAGEVLVQRGTIHNWVNHGPEDCVMAFVLIAAKPLQIGAQSLKAKG